MDRDDSAKAPLKIPSILHSHCPMRITPIGFFSNQFALFLTTGNFSWHQ